MLLSKKYLSVAKTAYINSVAYPIRFWIYLIVSIAPILVLALVWKAVFNENPKFFGYTYNDLILYYTVTFFIRRLTVSGSAGNYFIKLVKQGDFNSFLIKPISFIKYVFVDNLTWRISESGATIFALFVVLYLVKPEVFLNYYQLPLFLISVLLGAVLNFFVYACIGTVAFFTVNTWGVKSFFGRVVDVASGSIVPLDLFSKSILNVFSTLPFKYMHFVPVSVITSNLSLAVILQNIFFQFVWILITLILFRFLYKKGIKNYEAVGI